MFNPKGNLLPALEKNILKYRAFEMSLILFYAESLKALIIGIIQSTDKIQELRDNKNARIPPEKKRKLQEALKIFVADGILTDKESDEIQYLIDYRNIIAHDIQKLTADINQKFVVKEVKYNYGVRKRLKFYNNDIPCRVMSRYVIPISFDWLSFAATEKTYEDELKRLSKKKIRQFKLREKKILRLNKELSLDNTNLIGEAHPYHPRNKSENGRLTKRGVDICYRLFDAGKKPLAVAYLMGVSYQTACNHVKVWKMIKTQRKKT